VLLRTKEMTSVKARTDAAAHLASSSTPVWVESTVRRMRLVEGPMSCPGRRATVGLAVVLGAVSTASGRLSSVLSAWA
jgi:hypothetical protein